MKAVKGVLLLQNRKHKPPVWAYCYTEVQSDGTLKRVKKVIGTTEEYPTESDVFKAIEPLRLNNSPAAQR